MARSMAAKTGSSMRMVNTKLCRGRQSVRLLMTIQMGLT